MATDTKEIPSAPSASAPAVQDVTPPEGFDINAYATSYQGPVLVRRLRWIAKRCAKLRAPAFRLAIDELKRGFDMDMYRTVVSEARSTLGKGLGDKWGYDNDFANKREQSIQDKINRAEIKWQNIQRDDHEASSLLKPTRDLIELNTDTAKYNVAMGKVPVYLDLAADLKEKLWGRVAAMKIVLRNPKFADGSRMFLTHENAAINICSRIGDGSTMAARVRAMSGLQALRSGRYDTAALRFRQVGNAPIGKDLLASRDVALYGAVCSMASLKRSELRKTLIDAPGIRELLSTVPGLRDAVLDFVQCRFKRAFAFLNSLRSKLDLDCELGPHRAVLYSKIRDAAVGQYFMPFSHARISRMAAVFGVSDQDMEQRLTRLVKDGKIPARIDTFNKILVARRRNPRQDAYRRALDAGTTYVRDATSALMRLSLVQNKLAVENPANDESAQHNLGARVGPAQGGVGSFIGLV